MISPYSTTLLTEVLRDHDADDSQSIGFCTDLTGLYQTVDGPADAIRMAIEDKGPTVAGRRVEVLLGNQHNNEQVAATIAQRWYANGVDVMISGVNSDTSLAVTAVAAYLGKPFLVVGAGTSVQTRERAAPSIVPYAYDTLALATVPGLVLTSQGMRRWFFITADYAFGRQLEEDGTAAIKAAGGYGGGLSRSASRQIAPRSTILPLSVPLAASRPALVNVTFRQSRR